MSEYVYLYPPQFGERWQHRAVWTQYHGKIPKGMVVHHINGIKDDNRVENLALMTYKENSNKSDIWGKGYAYYPKNKTSPYISKRHGKNLGSFGTACGAIMKSRMYYVNQIKERT